MNRYRLLDYQRWKGGATQSAEVVVPFVLRLTSARSIIDVGCGQGAWVAEFFRNGVHDVLGVDGHADPSMFLLPQKYLLRRDLTQPFAADVGRRFDLVVSLEVAEHLPPAAAEPFVDGLAALGDTVLFSAAVPGQGGRHHLNEQWPSYWAGLFARRGFRGIDAIRAAFWADDRVEAWYRQNTILYERGNVQSGAAVIRPAMPLDVVHPRVLEHIHQKLVEARKPRPLRVVLSELPELIERAIKRRLPGTSIAPC